MRLKSIFLLIQVLIFSGTCNAQPSPEATGQMVFPRFRATYVTIPPEETAEILADDVIVVPNIRILEPLCAPVPIIGTGCVEFSMSMIEGTSRAIQMKSINLATGIKSAASNSIIITQPMPTVLSTAIATSTPTSTPTVTATTTATATATPTPTGCNVFASMTNNMDDWWQMVSLQGLSPVSGNNRSVSQRIQSANGYPICLVRVCLGYGIGPFTTGNIHAEIWSNRTTTCATGPPCPNAQLGSKSNDKLLSQLTAFKSPPNGACGTMGNGTEVTFTFATAPQPSIGTDYWLALAFDGNQNAGMSVHWGAYPANLTGGVYDGTTYDGWRGNGDLNNDFWFQVYTDVNGTTPTPTLTATATATRTPTPTLTATATATSTPTPTLTATTTTTPTATETATSTPTPTLTATATATPTATATTTSTPTPTLTATRTATPTVTTTATRTPVPILTATRTATATPTTTATATTTSTPTLTTTPSPTPTAPQIPVLTRLDATYSDGSTQTFYPSVK